ncbi:hypothetical protein YPPY47_2383 [Yersinia pestis PY-47]|nr:hypothetical protein YPPY47_2383 [Yersinia pestis PY-47]EIT59031.1 hypothetical protein YPPY103_2420 [Yersinia pestis PY-103]
MKSMAVLYQGLSYLPNARDNLSMFAYRYVHRQQLVRLR